MNKELENYLNENILTQYANNSNGHNIEHIQYVVERSMIFANEASQDHDINMDMVYTIAVYHDIGHMENPKEHERVSANMLLSDKNLHKWFSESEILIMHDAVAEHRASSKKEPSTIYGKIVSSADRSTSVDDILSRSYAYHKNQHPTATFNELVNDSYEHIKAKFGQNGYASAKMYFKDVAYETFLNQMLSITKDIETFKEVFAEINNVNKESLREQIQKYIPCNNQEYIDKQSMLQFMDTFDDVVTRNNVFGHFTASAFVVDEYCSKALMLHHNIMNDWIYPGGHADGEYDLCAVAQREVEEETGLVVEPMFKEIFAIQAAPVKGHVKNDKYVSAHIHYDVLFVFKAKREDMNKIRVLASENKSVEWWDLRDTFTNQNVAEWAIPVNRKIVQKLGY